MGVGIALSGIALQGAVNNFLQLGRDFRIYFARRHRIVQQPVIHDGKGVRPLKRNFSREHFIQHHAQRVEVAAGVPALPFHLLRRDVIRRSHGR